MAAKTSASSTAKKGPNRQRPEKLISSRKVGAGRHDDSAAPKPQTEIRARGAQCRSRYNNSRSTPNWRRIRLRWWIRLIPGILNAKAPIAGARQLALVPRCEPAVLGATHPAAVVGAPRIDDHGCTWPCTCSQCEDGRGRQPTRYKLRMADLPEEAVARQHTPMKRTLGAIRKKSLELMDRPSIGSPGGCFCLAMLISGKIADSNGERTVGSQMKGWRVRGCDQLS